MSIADFGPETTSMMTSRFWPTSLMASSGSALTVTV